MAAAKRKPPPHFELVPLQARQPAAAPGIPRKALASAVHEAAKHSARVPLDQAPFPEIFGLVVQVLADVNRRLPPGTPAEEAAKRQAVALCHYLGGHRWWWPTPGRISELVRDWVIYHQEYDGANAAELAERHQIPLDTLTRILRRMRKQHLAAIARGRVPVEPRSNQFGAAAPRVARPER